MTNLDKIAQAMLLNKTIEFKYEGRVRVGSPYIIYRPKNDILLHVYQTDGYSSDKKLGWKIYKMKGIEDIKILDNKFEISEEYNKKSKMYKNIKISI